MSYLVFARKYRPQTFREVIGQDHVAGTLQNALESGRLAHAYLFCGPRGVGKTTMARILAKAVNCMERPGADPCGACEACRGIAAGGDVDVLEIDAASNRKVEDVEPLVDATRYIPQRSPKKVFIVDEVHMLSRHAWNALLKTLEEPPDHVLFVFATTEPHKMPATARSRCQRFDFRRITPKGIETKLRRIAEAEGLASSVADESVFREIAERATGGMRDAETLLDQLIAAAPSDRPLEASDLVAILGDTPREVRLELLRHAQAGAMNDALAAAAGVVDAGADPGALLRDLYGDLHAAAVANATGGETELGLEWCLAAAELVGRHLVLGDRSRAPRATLDLALLAVSRLGDVRDLEEMVERLERLSEGGAAPAARAARPASAAPLDSATQPASAAPPAREPRPGAETATPNIKEEWQRLRGTRGPAKKVGPEVRGDAPSREPRGQAAAGLSGADLARLRGLPRVREVLAEFRGRIEKVRVKEDG
ncbi:MAG: DNA polymerase III subunit gamma/tau [Planctomycetota bacterium]